MKLLFDENEFAVAGINELNFILEKTSGHIPLTVDFTLARGLNYYTGIIFEAKAPAHIKMGSIGGGGRYDDLTGLFGVPNIPGVGISFGVDRIYDVLEEMQLFPAELFTSTKVLFFNEGEEKVKMIFDVINALRANGVSCELYPDFEKEEKQFKYAKRKNIPYIATLNEEGRLRVKNIPSGESIVMNFEEVKEFIFL